jgi:hypothetical protein
VDPNRFCVEVDFQRFDLGRFIRAVYPGVRVRFRVDWERQEEATARRKLITEAERYGEEMHEGARE